MFQITGQIKKTTVDLFHSSIKIDKSDKQSVLGHRTSNDSTLHFNIFFGFYSFLLYSDSFFSTL